MQELLGESKDVRPLQRGETVEGTIAQVSPEGILVHIGLKTEGVVPPREMRTLSAEALSKLQVGQSIPVTILRSENGEGQVLLSYDKAQVERGRLRLQEALANGHILEGEVTGFNKGGLIVRVQDIQGFVPLSQISSLRNQGSTDESGHLASLVGSKLRLKVLELDPKRDRAIFSERAAAAEWRQQQKERLLSELKEGQVVKGRISSLCSFGAFVDLGGADGLVHISELSWQPVRTPAEVVKVGEEITVQVLKVDQGNKKISLSLKRLAPEPWHTVAQTYQVGQLVKGTITKLVDFGAFARLEGGIEGLIHISELSDKRLYHPKEAVEEGQEVTLKIIRIEPERRRIALSLRQVEEAEALAWFGQTQTSRPESASA